MATIAEVAPDIYRINVATPGAQITFSCFLIKDDVPVMVETSFSRVFDEVKEQIAKVVDPSLIQYVVVPHYEADECGSLNHFLALNPQAIPLCSTISARSYLSEFSTRQPRAMKDNEVLQIGKKRLRFLMTPYIHQWDSLLIYEETEKVLFSSDLFMQPGDNAPVIHHDISDSMVALYQRSGLLPSEEHLKHALDLLEPLDIKVVAAHHGSVIASNIDKYFKALRENRVTGLLGSATY